MKSLSSQLLVASPRLPDANFYRSVVLIIHHDNNGAFGLVLNRPLDTTVADLWEMIAGEPCDVDQTVGLGGPVAGPLVAIHMHQDCSEAEILPGVYFAAHKDHLNQIVRHSVSPFRLFSGYSGWMGGQLEAELKAGGWMTTPARQGHIFEAGDDLWETTMRSIGRQITAPLIRRVGEPQDPSMN